MFGIQKIDRDFLAEISEINELTIKAKAKEISLVIDILNRIYNFKGDWNRITFFDGKKHKGSIMIPEGYFKEAEMTRKNVEE